MSESWISFCHFVVPVLINGVLYGAISVLLAVFFRHLLRLNASARCILWQMVLASILVVPLLMQINALGQTLPLTNVVPQAASVPPVGEENRLLQIGATTASLIVAGWLTGVAILMFRLQTGIHHVLRMKRRAQPIGCRLPDRPRSVVVAVSTECGSPMTVGYVRPMILMPASLAPFLSGDEMKQILNHEIAHVRRFDDWGRLLQRAAESILFVNPLVLWLGRRLDLDREIACDDFVAKDSRTSRLYAKCLIRLAELISYPDHSLPAAGVLHRKSQLSKRIDMLMESRGEGRAKNRRRGFAAIVAVVLFSCLFLAHTAPLIAVSEPEKTEISQHAAAPKAEWIVRQDTEHASREEFRSARAEHQRIREEKRAAQLEQMRVAMEQRRMRAEAMRVLPKSPMAPLDTPWTPVPTPAIAPLAPLTESSPMAPVTLPTPTAPPTPMLVPVAAPSATPAIANLPTPMPDLPPVPTLLPIPRIERHIRMEAPDPVETPDAPELDD